MASTGKKSKNSSKLFARIIALFLGALMILGAAMLLIEVLSTSLSAADVTDTYQDMNVRVGLVWGSSSVSIYPTATLYGYELGIQDLTDETRSFTPVLTSAATSLIIAKNVNLVKSSSGYAVASDSVTVGGHHIEVDTSYQSYQEVQSVIGKTAAALSSLSDIKNGCYAFPAYEDGIYRIRVYDFASKATAESGIKKVQSVFPDAKLRVVGNDGGCLSVIDPATDRVVFECASDKADITLGIRAAANPKSASEEVYITNNSLLYQDVLAFRREETGAFSVINVIRLEDYVEGVLPYEISNSWPLETEKAFAIAIRTYIMANLGKRESLGFDLYNTSQDQVYKGAGQVNDRVRQAVRETRGMVITYNGDLCSIFYSNCFRNASAAPEAVWGGAAYPYLRALPTPWESYTDDACKGGFWTHTVTAAELATKLKSMKEGAQLTGKKIVSAEVVEYVPNSTYVQKMIFTDENGKTATVTTCSDIRALFGTYSANFVIGKGSVSYTKDTVLSRQKGTVPAEYRIGTGVSGILLEQARVMTASSISSFGSGASAAVLTANGIDDAGTGEVQVAYVEETNVAPAYKVTTETLTASATNAGDYILVGKGYGHGVGISQYGAKCLGDFGFDCHYIIKSYFIGVTLTDRTDVR